MEQRVLDLVHLVSEHGDLGLLPLAAVFFVGSLAFVPRLPLCAAAGLLYGLPAFPVILLASALGAVAGFLLSRHVLQRRFRRAVERRPHWQRILQAVDTQGWILLGLLRLASPLPGSVTSYLFGLTSIRLWQFMVATFVGLAPQTFVLVYLGSLGRLALDGQPMDTVKLAVVAAGVVTSVAIVWLVGRQARAAVAARVEEE